MIVPNATDITEESFTRRFLRRATTNVNNSFTKASNDTKRKLNILQAINGNPTEPTIAGGTDLRDKSQRSNFSNPEKIETGERNKLAKTNGSTKDISKTSVTKEFEKADNGWTYYDKTMPSCNIVTPKLVKVKTKRLPMPERTHTTSKKNIIESEKANFDLIESKSELRSNGKNTEKSLTADKNLNESIDMDRTNETFAPYAGLNEAIRDLERDIELLELRSSVSDAYTLETSFELRNSLENWDGKSNEIHSNDIPRNSADFSMPERRPVATFKYKKNRAFSKKPKRMMPNLESTRKSSMMDLTKKNTSPSSIQSTISTITTATSSKFIAGDRNDDKYHNASSEIMENTIPSEVEKFLENALGDEMYDTSCVTNATLDSTEAQMCRLNKSQWSGELVTPSSHIIKKIKPPASEPLQETNTLNRTLVFYRSLSQRIKKKFRPRLKDKARPTEIPVPITILHHNDKVQELLQELEIQQTRIHQTSKALNLCNIMKKFQQSTQHIESERLLLLSTLKKRAVVNEIRRISVSNENAVILSERGEVNISNIALCLREEVLLSRNQTAEMSEWFVVTVSHESMVWATIAMNYSIENSKISFPGSVSIGNLTPNFKIIVSVYSLQLRDTNLNKKEERSGDHNVSCPSPTNFWKKVEKTRSKQNEIHCSSVRDTSFKLSGYVELTLQDIPLSSPWPLSMVPLNSILQGTIDLDLSCKLHISVTHAGFLTHGDEAGGFALWNRRWCVLEGYILKFWNYPQEQELKPPLLFIDLTHCVSNEVMMVDRTLCAKPRTLMFKTTRERTPQDQNSMLLECGSTRTIVRNLLSCDTVNDLMIWTSKLNYVLSVLRDWNSTVNEEVLTTDL